MPELFLASTFCQLLDLTNAAFRTVWKLENSMLSVNYWSWQPYLSELPKKSWKTLCFLSIVGVGNCSFQSYLNPGRLYVFDQLTVSLRAEYEKWRSYASCQLYDLTTIALGNTLKKMRTLCFPQNAWVDNQSFGSHLKKIKTLWSLSTVWVDDRIFPFLLLLPWVALKMLETPVLEPFRNSVGKLMCCLLWNLFWKGNFGIFNISMLDHWSCQIIL